MSGDGDKSGGPQTNAGPTQDGEVGYGKPPAWSRFQKGKSGNPRGRPKKARAMRFRFDAAGNPTDCLILEEAYRLVTIREGDKTIELPAIQASARSLGISAMKGSRLAQRDFAKLAREAEERQQKSQSEALTIVLQYKAVWQDEFDYCRLKGRALTQAIPHPDDIIVDMMTGEIRVEGPVDEQGKARLDAILKRRAESQAEVTYYAGLFRREKDLRRRATYLDDWQNEQRLFDIINDVVPARYKSILKNRWSTP